MNATVATTRTIISVQRFAPMVGACVEILNRNIRRKTIVPDYECGRQRFFELSSIDRVRDSLESNRARNWKHLGKAN